MLTDYDQAFSASTQRVDYVVSALLRQLPERWRESPCRILDLGCGDGEHALRLAEALPHSTVIGLDISADNIALAEARRIQVAAGSRVRFIAADYVTADLPAFDLIVSDGCLHLIPASDAVLFSKIARELMPDGILAFSMPFPCFYNRALGWIRRVLRAVRGDWSDALILWAAKAIHPRKSEAFLRQRVHYMYRLPIRCGGEQLNAELQERFRLVHWKEEHYPHASVGQAKHKLWLLRKAG